MLLLKFCHSIFLLIRMHLIIILVFHIEQIRVTSLKIMRYNNKTIKNRRQATNRVNDERIQYFCYINNYTQHIVYNLPNSNPSNIHSFAWNVFILLETREIICTYFRFQTVVCIALGRTLFNFFISIL